MGWGLVFFGYFLAFFLGQNVMLAMLLMFPGCLFMIFGLKKLSLYCHTFHYALWSAVLLAAVAVGRVAEKIVAFLSISPMEGTGLFDWMRYAASMSGTSWMAWAELVCVVLFHAALALGIKDIAMRVGVQKNAVRAMRNLVFVGLYAVCVVLMRTVNGLPAAIGAVTVLLELVWSICNCIMLYSCYMRIAPADDVEHERKPSRFAWINRLRNAYDEKTQKAIEESRAYYAQNAREKQEKRLARMSEKQRKKEELKQKRNQK